MIKTAGRRNFGYGKQMDWAGKQALRNRYGNGRFGTVAGHTERWRQFVTWCRDQHSIRDARLVDRSTVNAYGTCLADKVTEKSMTVSYAQNLLSSVNVVLESMRGDRRIRVAPATVVGKRSHARGQAPAGLDRQPRNVYPKGPSLYYVRKNKWIRLCRIDAPEEELHRELWKILSKGAGTLAAVMDDFIANRLPKKAMSTQRDYTNIIKRQLRPTFRTHAA